MNTKVPVARYSEHLYQLATETADPSMRSVWRRATDHKARISVGLGKYLDTTIKPAKPEAAGKAAA